MKTPDPVLQLLEELSDQAEDTSVVTVDTSFALVTVGADPDPFRLTATECELLLHSEDTVECLFSALGTPSASIELYKVRLSTGAETALTQFFDEVS
jgi:hypothetical protein